ncbi:MAG TPA: arylsulfatase, partial [Methylocella sp.]|nr:arylsulfatase [Methylocella sp.]
ILDVTGIPAPAMVDGIAQKPIEGVSLAYTFDKANADAPSPHKTQYFEMMGVQGLYSNGWMLSAVPVRPPWELLGTAILDPASAYKFELYDVRHDWTQYTDVAAANPAKLREMTDLMFAEFAKYQVLPLDASVATRMVTPRPSMSGGRKLFAFSGEPVTGIPRGTAPSLLNTSYTITAEIDVPQGGAEGMIVTDGGRFGGYGLYLLKGKPVLVWNLLDLKRVRWEGKQALPPGKHTIEYGFKYDGLGFATLAFNNISGIGRPGTGTLKVDGKVISTQTLERTVPLTLPWDETFDIGSDTGTPVDDRDYKVPFPFTGKIEKLTISVEPPQLTPEDEKRLLDAERSAHDAQ